MPIVDPDINADFTRIANQLSRKEITPEQFREATHQLLIDHRIILPEPEDMEPDDHER